MSLEAVGEHAGTLRRVIVVASKETLPFVGEFRNFVGKLLKREVEVAEARAFVGGGQLPDFNTGLEALLDLIDTVFARIEKREGGGSEDPEGIVVDVTGGTKICSLAGLAATQPFRRRCFQYVFARPNEPASIKIWDVTFTLDQRQS